MALVVVLVVVLEVVGLEVVDLEDVGSLVLLPSKLVVLDNVVIGVVVGG